MGLAHPLLGVLGGLLAALVAYYVADWPLWKAVCTFAVAGGIACMVSAGLCLLRCTIGESEGCEGALDSADFGDVCEHGVLKKT